MIRACAPTLLAALLAGAAVTATQAADPPSAPVPPVATPAAIVDAQLDAYRRRDLEGFLAFYADDAVLAKHPDQVTQTGKAQLRARYERGFRNPNVRVEILERITYGRFVVDHERVTAPPAKGELVAVVVYEIRDGKIVRATFLDQ